MQAFQWPEGTRADLKVYPKNHPQREPTEKFFADEVRRNIADVRGGGYVNLWLLVSSLKNLTDPTVKAGFETWLWKIEGVLGTDTCREIGKRVCEEEGFTIDEGNVLLENYRKARAEGLGLPENTTWAEINKAREPEH